MHMCPCGVVIRVMRDYRRWRGRGSVVRAARSVRDERGSGECVTKQRATRNMCRVPVHPMSVGVKAVALGPSMISGFLIRSDNRPDPVTDQNCVVSLVSCNHARRWPHHLDRRVPPVPCMRAIAHPTLLT